MLGYVLPAHPCPNNLSVFYEARAFSSNHLLKELSTYSKSSLHINYVSSYRFSTGLRQMLSIRPILQIRKMKHQNRAQGHKPVGQDLNQIRRAEFGAHAPNALTS